MKIKISKEGERKLVALAVRYKMEENEVVDKLVKDRWSVSDYKLNAQRLRHRTQEYEEKITRLENSIEQGDTPEWRRLDTRAMFRIAYNMGWHDFQVRHKEHPPVLEINGGDVFDKWHKLTEEQRLECNLLPDTDAKATYIWSVLPELVGCRLGYDEMEGEVKVFGYSLIPVGSAEEDDEQSET